MLCISSYFTKPSTETKTDNTPGIQHDSPLHDPIAQVGTTTHILFQKIRKIKMGGTPNKQKKGGKETNTHVCKHVSSCRMHLQLP